MKNQILFLLFSLFFVNTSCSNNNYFTKNEKNEIEENQNKELNEIPKDSVLIGIEQKIFKAFVISKTLQNTDELIKVENQLKEIKTNSSIVTYWLAYAYYYRGVYYLIEKNLEESEIVIKSGIDLLEAYEKKTSEYYTLLALLQNFSIQFAKGRMISLLAAEAKTNGEKALELDDNNLRAYYTLALNDFYTPEWIGGGKLTEEYCKTAISLDDQSIVNPYMPSWGKNLTYELLIKHYIKLEDFDLAKSTYKEAISKYPDDYLINLLASELIDK
jgi:tetratricopeptide (TPR) repeat protein